MEQGWQMDDLTAEEAQNLVYSAQNLDTSVAGYSTPATGRARAPHSHRTAAPRDPNLDYARNLLRDDIAAEMEIVQRNQNLPADYWRESKKQMRYTIGRRTTIESAYRSFQEWYTYVTNLQTFPTYEQYYAARAAGQPLYVAG
jgi:hypothetical protein